METSSTVLTADHLTAIRQNTDWRLLFEKLQIAKDEQKSMAGDWWGKSPFKPEERTASFHLGDRGWYCHSTHQGGGVLELVQRLHATNCYEAGRWLLDQGVSHVAADIRGEVQQLAEEKAGEEKEKRDNPPIRQDLAPQLIAKHPYFTERGITPQTLYELGAGFLTRPARKSGRVDPMNHRAVFQIRGLEEDCEGRMRPVVLGHIGRATTPIQEAADGKWWTYAGFKKSLEIYNIDRALYDERAISQIADTEHILIVEGCFDVAKLWTAGIHNVVATLGSHLSQEQGAHLDLLSELLGVDRFLIWYDRDQDATKPNRLGALNAAETLARRAFEVEVFDWTRNFSSRQRSAIPIPAEITDPAEFSMEQLRWLREEGWV